MGQGTVFRDAACRVGSLATADCKMPGVSICGKVILSSVGVRYAKFFKSETGNRRGSYAIFRRFVKK